MPPPTDSVQWFVHEVQVHEAALRGYLRRRFPEFPDHDDLVQETYARMLQARAEGTPVESAKAFLFVTARNLALDYFRRRQVVAIDAVAEVGEVFVYEDAVGVAETVGKKQELELLTRAIQSLPDRCRQVLTLRKIHGLSQKEIAARLSISEHTVEVQVANGVRRCAAFLARHGLP